MKLIGYFIVIFKKEFKETFSNPQVIIPSLILPFIMLIIFPLTTLFALYISKDSSIAIGIGESKINFNYAINGVFPLYFLIVSLTLSSIFSASSFVAEKEGQTIESIFYTPIKISDLFISKIITIFSIVMFIIVIFFILFFVIVNFFSLKIYGQILIPDFKWILFIFWFIPSFLFLFISIIVWISSGTKTFIAAQQIAGMFIFPIIFLYVYLSKFDNQIASNFYGGLVVFLISIFFIKFQSSRWKYEKFLK